MFTSTGATLEGLDGCKQGILPDNDSFKCLVDCVLREHRLLDQNGDLLILQIPNVQESMLFCAAIGEFDFFHSHTQ